MDDLPRPSRPRSNGSRWIRTTIWVVVGAMACFGGCAAMVLHGLSWNPPPSQQAKDLERVLVQSPIQDLDLPGLRLIEEGSDPGKRTGSGDFQLGDEVSSYRRYAFEGDQAAMCQAALDALLARGWALEYPDHEKGCADVRQYDRYDAPGQYHTVSVALRYVCDELTVRGTLYLNVEDSELDSRVLSLVIEAGYPDPYGQQSTTTSVQPSCT